MARFPTDRTRTGPIPAPKPTELPWLSTHHSSSPQATAFFPLLASTFRRFEVGGVLPSSSLLRKRSPRPDSTVGMTLQVLLIQAEVDKGLLNTHQKRKSTKNYQKQKNRTKPIPHRRVVHLEVGVFSSPFSVFIPYIQQFQEQQTVFLGDNNSFNIS